MVILMLKYFIIQCITKKKGASHLPAPPVGCSCLDDGPIPTAPPKTSMVTNQYNCIFFFNHIHHHTYFKSSYVHIQVFHILHHHIMKLLLAFKSFLPRRLIVEIDSENWFAAGCPIWQRELVRCRLLVRQRQLFRCRQPVWQRQLFRCRQRQLFRCRQRKLVRCRQRKLVRYRLPNSAARIGSL